MQINHPTTLTLDDHAQLERLMYTLIGSTAGLATVVRRKLETAVIILPKDAASDLVTSGRRVRYSVNGDRAEEHVLSWDNGPISDVSHISLRDSRGLALLGLRAGQSISLPVEGGTMIFKVESVAVPQEGKARSQAGSRSVSQHSEALAPRMQHAGRRFLRYCKHAFARIQKGRTETVLMRLSDATLRDIGITRGEIPHIAAVVSGLVPASSCPGKNTMSPRRSRSRNARQIVNARPNHDLHLT